MALSVTIPANTTAEVWVPVSGKPVAAPPGAAFSRAGSFDGTRYAVYNAGPGTYRFNNEGS